MDTLTREELVVVGGEAEWDEDFNNEYSVSDNDPGEAILPRITISTSMKGLREEIKEEDLDSEMSESDYEEYTDLSSNFRSMSI